MAEAVETPVIDEIQPEGDDQPVFERLEDGRWCYTVDLGDGSPAQRYFGTTQKEVVGKVGEAHKHATLKIREQKRLLKVQGPEVDPARPAVKFEPKQLTADERFALASQLQDPAKSQEAVRKLIEAEFGQSLDTVRITLQSVNDSQSKEACAREGAAFIAAHKDYKATPENEALIIQYLKVRNMAFTARNLGIAYEDLKDDLDLAGAIPQPAVTVRPRSTTTGIPARTSAARPAAKVELTVAEIQAMDMETYRRKMSDPRFREQVARAYGKK